MAGFWLCADVLRGVLGAGEGGSCARLQVVALPPPPPLPPPPIPDLTSSSCCRKGSDLPAVGARRWQGTPTNRASSKPPVSTCR